MASIRSFSVGEDLDVRLVSWMLEGNLFSCRGAGRRGLLMMG